MLSSLVRVGDGRRASLRGGLVGVGRRQDIYEGMARVVIRNDGERKRKEEERENNQQSLADSNRGIEEE